MVDHVDKKKRSQIMASVKQKNTSAELRLRRRLHKHGYRYRLHRKDLPGRPNIVFPSRRKVILVHGCFWHGHSCKWGKLPKSRLDYWQKKIAGNRDRDMRTIQELKSLGWTVMVVWQCELKDWDLLWPRILAFLGE
ncbi:very short patch repair endonuclease [Hyphococcus sp.]|uniref:very short patch repair endonuclease n=1 Tax=Hyphococcus sp. TaxID=2038636 RepID=UPI003CCC0FAE